MLSDKEMEYSDCNPCWQPKEKISASTDKWWFIMGISLPVSLSGKRSCHLQLSAVKCHPAATQLPFGMVWYQPLLVLNKQSYVLKGIAMLFKKNRVLKERWIICWARKMPRDGKDNLCAGPLQPPGNCGAWRSGWWVVVPRDAERWA